MTRPIPLPLRKQLNDDPRMHICMLCKTTVGIQFHHALYYRNRQINEAYAILGVCDDCHNGTQGVIPQKNRDICELEAIMRGLQSDIETKYPKVD